MLRNFIIILFQILLCDYCVCAPVCKFKSLRSSKVNWREGPGYEYKTILVYRCCGMPVKVIRDRGSWVMIEDKDGVVGWVNSCLLSNRPTVFVISDGVPLHKACSSESCVMAYFNKGVVAKLCKTSGDWHMISSGGFKGWVLKKFCWGGGGE